VFLKRYTTSRRSSIVATAQSLKKLQLLQDLIGEEDIGDEVTEVTVSNPLNSTHL
jgi:hypothetical protein